MLFRSTLLAHSGADIDASNYDGDTALIWAASCGHAAAVEVLMRVGADLHARNADGRTALDWAARNGHGPVVVILKRPQSAFAVPECGEMGA